MCDNCNTCSDRKICSTFESDYEQQDEMVRCDYCMDYFDGQLLEEREGSSCCPDCLAAEIQNEKDEKRYSSRLTNLRSPKLWDSLAELLGWNEEKKQEMYNWNFAD